MQMRELDQPEIARVWEIDRSEVIDAIYVVSHGKLLVKEVHYDMSGWPPGEPEAYQPLLEECYAHGGTFLGVFREEKLIAVSVLENRFIGPAEDTLQLKFLHVSHGERGQGLGSMLFRQTAELAHSRGASKLYISATPAKATVDFYQRRGCVLAGYVDPDLYALEPDDIHLEYSLS